MEDTESPNTTQTHTRHEYELMSIQIKRNLFQFG